MPAPAFHLTMATLYAGAIALCLSACDAGAPARRACTDYRIMTFTEYGVLGWTDVKTEKVCVLAERPTTEAKP